MVCHSSKSFNNSSITYHLTSLFAIITSAVHCLSFTASILCTFLSDFHNTFLLYVSNSTLLLSPTPTQQHPSYCSYNRHQLVGNITSCSTRPPSPSITSIVILLQPYAYVLQSHISHLLYYCCHEYLMQI
jgi:hypothetical protein